jgi:hypothetical protein
MLPRTLQPFACCLAILASLAACSLNPQPEPPLNDRGMDASYGAGGAGGMNSGGSGGGVMMDAAWEAGPPAEDASLDACTTCDCNCYAGGACETGPNGECPCEAGDGGASDADAEPDADQDALDN